MVFKFAKNQKVKHLLGDQLMLVVEYEKEMKQVKKNFFTDTKFVSTGEFTENVLCVWYDNGKEHSRYFDQDRLVLAES